MLLDISRSELKFKIFKDVMLLEFELVMDQNRKFQKKKRKILLSWKHYGWDVPYHPYLRPTVGKTTGDWLGSIHLGIGSDSDEVGTLGILERCDNTSEEVDLGRSA